MLGNGYKRCRRYVLNECKSWLLQGKCNMWFDEFLDDGVVRRYSHDDCMVSRRGPGYEAAETASPRYVGRRFR